MEKIVGTNVYHRHWPRWLGEKTDSLIRLGLSKREICERILNENNTYIKMHSLNKKIENRSLHIALNHKLGLSLRDTKCRGRDSHPR